MECLSCVKRTAVNLAAICDSLSAESARDSFLKLYPDTACLPMTQTFVRAYRNAVPELLPVVAIPLDPFAAEFKRILPLVAWQNPVADVPAVVHADGGSQFLSSLARMSEAIGGSNSGVGSTEWEIAAAVAEVVPNMGPKSDRRIDAVFPRY
jgi:hypothetical protein